MTTKCKLAVISAALVILLSSHASADMQVGAGANFWTTLDSLDYKNVDDNGVSYYLSIQVPSQHLLRFEFDLEVLEAGYRGAPEDVYAPMAYLVLGDTIYGAVGIGAYYSDGDFYEDEFYAFRIGFDMRILRALRLDINANYRFDDWGEDNEALKNINTDTITLGAAVRVEF